MPGTYETDKIVWKEPVPGPGGMDRQAGDASANGFMRFFNMNAYPNTLFRFSSPSRRSSEHLEQSSSGDGTSPKVEVESTTGEAPGGMPLAAVRTAEGSASGGPARALGITRMYPLSTVLIVALIAFLMGSLLRSLLSPADFIYVVTDRKEIDGEEGTGWREIKRLLEVKYLVGGWDFQIAVVRRH